MRLIRRFDLWLGRKIFGNGFDPNGEVGFTSDLDAILVRNGKTLSKVRV